MPADTYRLWLLLSFVRKGPAMDNQKRARINDMCYRWLLTIIALACAAVYAIYCIVYWGGLAATGDALVGMALGLLTPHFLALAVGIVFSALALAQKRAGWDLVAGVAYLLAIVFFPGYWGFLIVPCFLSFAGWLRMRRYVKFQEKLEDQAVEDKVAAATEDAPNQEMARMADQADEAAAKKAQEAKVEEADISDPSDYQE